MMMAECSRIFEKLPILDHAEILRNILYSGVWCRYEMIQKRGNKRMRDPYQVLGVSQDASEEEIKRHIGN